MHIQRCFGTKKCLNDVKMVWVAGVGHALAEALQARQRVADAADVPAQRRRLAGVQHLAP